MEREKFPCRRERKVNSCKGCEFEKPDLDLSNYEVWDLWGKSTTQWRVVVGDRIYYIGLDYNALYLIAKTLDVEITPAVLNKIKHLENKWVTAKNAKGG
ncbi:MAG: Phage related hypothetical protein [Firmicutes bacterium]|nr:Phage related hypothetical protein [Bacillota bacterium]